MSVGHVARLLEDAGIATVIIAVKAFRQQMQIMTLPRVVITPSLMGRPLGAPGDHESHKTAVLAALDLLESAPEVGTILDIQGRYRPGLSVTKLRSI